MSNETVMVIGLNPISLETVIDVEKLSSEKIDNYFEFKEELIFNQPGTIFTATEDEWFVMLNLLCGILSSLNKNEECMKIINGEIEDYFKGFDSSELCEEMSENLYKRIVNKLIEIDEDTVYIGTGSWNTYETENGHMITKPVPEDLVLQYLDLSSIGQYYIENTLPVIDGVKYYPSKFAKLPQIIKFLEFIKNCGGFEVVK